MVVLFSSPASEGLGISLHLIPTLLTEKKSPRHWPIIWIYDSDTTWFSLCSLMQTLSFSLCLFEGAWWTQDVLKREPGVPWWYFLLEHSSENNCFPFSLNVIWPWLLGTLLFKHFYKGVCKFIVLSELLVHMPWRPLVSWLAFIKSKFQDRGFEGLL